MKALALHVAAVSALFAGAASAADIRMPVKAPPPAPVAVYSWTGCYVGAGGGYGMFNQEALFINGGVPLGLSNDVGGRGWFGTVQVGCDYQVGSNIVIGAFGDYDFSGIKGDMAIVNLAAVGEEKLKNSWAAGGRIGWIPFQTSQLLVFVSGGYTQARFGQVDLLSAPNGIPRNLALPKHTYSGWFLGAGYEYGIGWLPGLFWKTEYRFADYGSERVQIFSTLTGLPTPDSVDAHKYIHTVRSELVWRFNWSGTAAAYAADSRAVPVKAPARVAPAYNWTGCYVGAGGGYGMLDQESTPFVGGVPVGISNDNGGRGWFGTVQAGCDYQIGSNIIIGAFGDYDFSGIKGDMGLPTANGVGEEKLKGSWAAGGRIGWVPFQASQLLVFVSGGYTQARFDEVSFRNAFNGAPTVVGLAKNTYDGWLLGSGYEYGLGFLPGLFWKTEYRFASHGKEHVNILVAGVPNGQTIESNKYIHTVRSEIVWRFNFGGPVVARY
jgi:hypothetical protein